MISCKLQLVLAWKHKVASHTLYVVDEYKGNISPVHRQSVFRPVNSHGSTVCHHTVSLPFPHGFCLSFLTVLQILSGFFPNTHFSKNTNKPSVPQTRFGSYFQKKKSIFPFRKIQVKLVLKWNCSFEFDILTVLKVDYMFLWKSVVVFKLLAGKNYTSWCRNRRRTKWYFFHP